MKEKKKKSFIFNCEWQEVLMEYPPEVRLEVYDAIIEYVASGKLSELKPLAKMAFSFIKKEIDYNQERYDEKLGANKENGRKGGNPNFKKGQPNPYYQKDENKDNPTLPEITQDNPTLPEITLYDNEYDNDIKENSLSGVKEIPKYEKDVPMSLDECHAYILKNYTQWIETTTMNMRQSGFTSLTPDSFKEFLSEFFVKLQNEGETEKSPSDARRHFFNWLRLRLGDSPKEAYKQENEKILANLEDGIYRRFIEMVKEFAPYCFANMKMPTEKEVTDFKCMFKSTMKIKKALMQVENNIALRGKREYLGQTIRDQLEFNGIMKK